MMLTRSFSPFIFKLFAVVVICLFFSCKPEQDREEQAADDFKSEFAMGDTLQVHGSLICAHCYALNPENTGHDHQLPQTGFKENCAGFCATLGYPVGVLVDKGQDGENVWVIRTSSQLFSDYMTETVRVEGTFVSKGVIEPLNIEMKKGEDQWITIL